MLIEQICIFEPNGGREFAAGQNGRFIFSEFGNVASFIPPTWPKWQPFQCNFGAVLERVPVGRSSLGAITEQFQSNFRAILEQFQSNFRAISEQSGREMELIAIPEQFQSSFGAITEQLKSKESVAIDRWRWIPNSMNSMNSNELNMSCNWIDFNLKRRKRSREEFHRNWIFPFGHIFVMAPLLFGVSSMHRFSSAFTPLPPCSPPQYRTPARKGSRELGSAPFLFYHLPPHRPTHPAPLANLAPISAARPALPYFV